MIYFDENNKAYGFEIENPIASIDDETWAKYCTTNKWTIKDGQFVGDDDIDTYISNQTKKEDLNAQILLLDQKRIRAIAEPGQKDENTSWLQYYTQQIQDLRTQIAGL